MFNVFIMNLIVLVSAGLLLKYFFSFETIIDYLLAFFLVYFAQIVLSLQLLGLFNVLYLNNVIWLNLSVLIILFIVIRVLKLKSGFGFKEKFSIAVRNISFNKPQIFCISVITGFFIVKVAINLANPPFGWDSISYHLAFPVEWLKHGNLNNPIVISGDPSVSYYPINGSLFFLWFILPLKNVFLADLGQVPFFIAAFLAVFSIARKIGLNKEYAFFSASLFSFIPNYFKQLEISYVDIIVASLFLITFNFLINAYRRRSFKNLTFAAISLGLMLGTKTTALPLVLLLLVLFVFAPYQPTRSVSYRPRRLVRVGLVFGIVVILGGFSYIRNILETGNPLYPLNLKIFDFVIFKGVADNSVYRTGIRPGDFSLAKILFSEGLGAQTVLLGLPAVLSALLLFLKQRKTSDLIFRYFLILPILIILIFRFILPLPNLRYIYPLFAISLIIAFYLLDILKVPKTITGWIAVICMLASAGENGKGIELAASFIMAALIFIFLLKIARKKIAVVLFAIFLILSFPVLSFLERDYIKNEYCRYITMVKYSGFWPDAVKTWQWLDRNTDKNNIAYIGRPVPFPLYGSNFKNNVYYISVNQTEPAMLHYFPDSKYIWGYEGNLAYRNFEDENNYRGKANFNVWLENLRRKNTDYLFVYSEINTKTDEPFPMEDKWARQHPEIFELVFENKTIHIYKVTIAS